MPNHKVFFQSYFPRWIGFYFRKWDRAVLGEIDLFVWVLNIGFWELGERYIHTPTYDGRYD